MANSCLKSLLDGLLEFICHLLFNRVTEYQQVSWVARVVNTFWIELHPQVEVSLLTKSHHM